MATVKTEASDHLSSAARSLSDFGERLLFWRRWSQSALTREGWYYLLVFAFVVSGGLLRDINLLLVVAGMMAGPIVYNWRHAVVSLRGVRLERESNFGVFAGEPLEVDLSLCNASRRHTCSAILVEEILRAEAGPARGDVRRGEVLFGHVPPGETRREAYSLHLTRRGRYRARSLRATTRFPFGLMRRSRAFRERAEIVVYPRLGRLTRAWRDLEAKTLLGNRNRNRIGHQEGDFLGLRDWQPGDPRRWIHWRTSARRGSMVVRQFEQQDSEDLMLLVDLFAPTPHVQADTERILSFAATILATWSRKRGSRLRLIINGAEFVDLAGAASRDVAQRAFSALAVAMPTSVDQLQKAIAAGSDETSANNTLAAVLSLRESPNRGNAGKLEQESPKRRAPDPAPRFLARAHWLSAANDG
ncbi:MAG: DUF58 domain-containing protein, partial [Planctomycetales bacterium]|nr:DUF58 domain-containing protein [Planctomycetales bacterium]